MCNERCMHSLDIQRSTYVWNDTEICGVQHSQRADKLFKVMIAPRCTICLLVRSMKAPIWMRGTRLSR